MITHFDFLISGASVAGCAAAVLAARSGKRVAITEIREFAGYDMTGTLRLYGAAEEPRASLLRTLGIEIPADGKFSLSEGALKKQLAASLTDAGVTVFYLSSPVSVRHGADGYTVTLATKCGTLSVTANRLADAGDVPLLASLLSGREIPLPAHEQLSFSAVVSGVTDRTARTLPTLDKTEAALEPFPMGESCYLRLTFPFTSPREIERRRGVMLGEAIRRLLCYLSALTASDAAFSSLLLQSVAYDIGAAPLSLPETPVLRILPASDAAAVRALLASPDPTTETAPKSPVSRTHHARVSVAGLGTGGACAALALLRQGIVPTVSDAKPYPGGTRTLGLVTGLWHGYQDGFSKLYRTQLAKEYFAAYAPGLRMPPVIREMLYTYLVLEDAGAPIFPCALAFDADVADGALRTYRLACEWGVLHIHADYTVDGTGDGDLAASAGASFTYGSRRDGMSYSASMWGSMPVAARVYTENHYHGDFGILRPYSYEDYLCAHAVAQSWYSDYSDSPMLTVRESRHIVGEHVLTLQDILLDTVFPDTLAVGLCPFDAHGYNDTELEMCGILDAARPLHHFSPRTRDTALPGLISREMPGESKLDGDLEIRVPLRSFLPKGIARLAIVGKCISATQDASGILRMVADIQNCGYALGYALACAAKRDCELLSLRPDDYQEHLTEIGVLPPWGLAGSDTSPAALIGAIADGDALACLRLAAHARDTVLPLLRRTDVPGASPMLTTARAWFGDGAVADALLTSLSDPSLNTAEEGYLLCLLSRIAVCDRTKREMTVALLAERMDAFVPQGDTVTPRGTPYAWSRIENRVFENNSLLLSLIYGAERLGDPVLGEHLALLGARVFTEEMYSSGTASVYAAHTALRHAAALHRCGHPTGKTLLARFADDPCETLRDFAAQETMASGAVTVEFL